MKYVTDDDKNRDDEQQSVNENQYPSAPRRNKLIDNPRNAPKQNRIDQKSWGDTCASSLIFRSSFEFVFDRK